ncbi:MAG: Gfo/Idh/MocA family oxidoreductase [Candidatus Nanopelagicales bacterium]|nr:Gfo/Idh/MocA family oxidoreductase [Candidatus Nanopelagicales bacterium]MCF8536368.1 Gfo/Idh/MocA family oxidoreductase [Candidatus Nanopelagicales bacterium]MCF8541552.1 Gfo/Idh/MocA family oxidoreductase [Candidatus Nanopelagicales bacterium]MCF8556529.1 Gfo/Idh/MocA family oxidoreductase [Candidatus Nanopelagicales bacterium]
MSRPRIGVIGAGAWAVSAHLPAIKARMSEVDLVAVSGSAAHIRRIADSFDCPIASADVEDVLSAGCDGIVVSSPGGLHFLHGMRALDAGAHVLCEKPMTLDPAEAWALTDAARVKDRLLTVSFGWNFMPIVRDAVRLLEEQPIGDLEQLSISMSSQTRELLLNTGSYPDATPETVPEQSTWTDPRLAGGGYGQAQLSHALALAFALVDEPVRDVFAWMRAPVAGSVELHDAVSMRFANGAVGSVSGGSAHLGANGNKHHLSVRGIGSSGQFLVDVDREAVVVYSEGQETALNLAANAGAYVPSGPVNGLLDLILGRTSMNPAPGALGAHTVDVLDAAYRSAREGGPVACSGRW